MQHPNGVRVSPGGYPEYNPVPFIRAALDDLGEGASRFCHGYLGRQGLGRGRGFGFGLGLGCFAIVATPALSVRRPGFLAELGWQRLRSGKTDDPSELAPIYLRPRSGVEV